MMAIASGSKLLLAGINRAISAIRGLQFPAGWKLSLGADSTYASGWGVKVGEVEALRIDVQQKRQEADIGAAPGCRVVAPSRPHRQH